MKKKIQLIGINRELGAKCQCVVIMQIKETKIQPIICKWGWSYDEIKLSYRIHYSDLKPKHLNIFHCCWDFMVQKIPIMVKYHSFISKLVQIVFQTAKFQ